jgi:Holliday junction resolvase RusA-like endonuclease
MRFIIVGPPRTKKNHQQIRINRRTGARFVAQSDAASAWETAAVLQLRTQLHKAPSNDPSGRVVLLPYFNAPVNMRALIYRDRAGRADLLNYLAAVSDALEVAGVVANDELVAGVDGSRVFIDRERPRVEVELTPLSLS